MGQVTAALECGVETLYCDFEDPRRYKEAVSLFKSSISNSQSTIFLATPRILKPGEIGYQAERNQSNEPSSGPHHGGR